MSWFVSRFEIDVRSLAVFRIGLATMVLIDLFNRAQDLRMFYSDEGVLPLSMAVVQANKYHWSFHFANGSVFWAVILFLIAAVFAVMLLLGYKTKLATVVSWVLLVSLHNRNGLVLQGGDELLRMLLLWGMFLPLGETFSLDKKYGRGSIFSMATVALYLQLIVVYFVNGVHKASAFWLPEGSAIKYALYLDKFATHFGHAIRDLPLWTFVSWMVRPMFFAGPLLGLLFKGKVRTLVALSFIAFHLGIGLTMKVGLLPLIAVVGWLPWLPGNWWKYFDKKPKKIHYTAKRWIHIVVAFLLICVILWVNPFSDAGQREIRPVALSLRLDQNWAMFSPHPPVMDIWFGYEGLRNGSVVKSITMEKPSYVAGTYKNQRWRKYLETIDSKGQERHRNSFAMYVCREWNLKGEEIDMIKVYQFTEYTMHNFSEGPTRNTIFAMSSCPPW